MRNPLDASRGELGLDICGPELPRLFLPPQDVVHVANRQPAHEQVSLFPGAKLGNRAHFVGNPR